MEHVRDFKKSVLEAAYLFDALPADDINQLASKLRKATGEKWSVTRTKTVIDRQRALARRDPEKALFTIAPVKHGPQSGKYIAILLDGSGAVGSINSDDFADIKKGTASNLRKQRETAKSVNIALQAAAPYLRSPHQRAMLNSIAQDNDVVIRKLDKLIALAA